MMRTLISTLLLFHFNLYAQSWTPISPIEGCSKFKIHYKAKTDKTYEVKINIKGLDEIYPIENINDLSVLTDEISYASTPICSEISNQTLDAVACNPNIIHTTEYKTFLETSANIIANISDENLCDQLNDYLELQTKVDGLSNLENLSIKKSKNLAHIFFKILSDDDTDEMINLYNSCGKKANSHKFIKNMILLEVKNACITPAPPGYISFEDASEISEVIASKYKNMSLVDISTKKKSIEADAIQIFTDIALESEIKGLIGSYIPDTNKFIAGLESYNSFKERKGGKDSIDYLNNVFKPDVTLEIAQKVVPIIVEGTLLPKIPEGIDPKEKEKLISEMNAIAQAQYQTCMKPHYERIGYNKKLSDKKLIELRSDISEKYCHKNYGHSCAENDCSQSVNLFTDKKSPGDTDIIQGCVMASITKAIKPILNYSVESALVDIKDDYHLSDDMIEGFKKSTWNELLSCSMRNISEEQGLEKNNDPEALFNNPIYLQSVSTANFENIILRCSTAAEMKVSKDVVGISLKNHASLQALFSDGKTVNYKGQHYGTIDELVKEINSTTYTSCVNGQQLEAQKNPNFIPSAMLCRPAIEISAATIILNQELESAMGKDLIETPKAKLILKEFENCSTEAKDKAIKDIGSNGISNDEEANKYLDEKSNFYSCVKTGLYAVSSLVGEHEYELATVDAQSLVTNKQTISNLKTAVGEKVKECFQEEIEKQAVNWSGFLAFNDNGGITTTKEKCSAVTEEYALSSIIYKETIDTLKPLIDDKYLDASSYDIGNIMAQSAAKLRRKYSIELPDDLDKSQYIQYSIGKAYTEYLKIPGNNMDGFIAEYSDIATEYAVKKIHSNLEGDIIEITKDSKHSKAFTDAFDAQCVEEIYTRFMKDSPSDAEGMKMDKLASYIASGINFQKGISEDHFNKSISKLKSQCDNMKSYKTEKDFEKSELYNIILSGQLYDLFTNQFSSSILKNIDDQIKDAKEPYKSIKVSNLQYMKKQMKTLLDKEVNNPKAFQENIFQDGSIMKFAMENLAALQSDDPIILDKITKKLIYKLYQNSDTGKFADEFAKINIETQVANGGVSDAVSKANDGATYVNIFGHRIGPNYYAMDEAKKLFGSPSKISSIIDWKNISLDQRKQYQSAILNHAVIPSLEVTSEYKIKNALSALTFARTQNHPDQKLDYMRGMVEEKINMDVNNQFSMDVQIMKTLVDLSKKQNPNKDRNELVMDVALSKAQSIIASTPNLNVSKESLAQLYFSKYHEYSLTLGVEDKLLSYKYKNGKTIEDKIEDAITAKTKERMFGTAESRKKNRDERLWREATSKWPTGPKL